jgi:DNA-binding PadR family transcriptional regulator
MSGYDIKKFVEMGLSHFWSESYGQLYPTLAELVAGGLASKTADRRGKRHRYVFTITPKGRRAFLEWLRKPTDLPRTRNEFQLKFFLCSRRPFEDGIRLLEEYRKQQHEVYEEYAVSETVLSQAVQNGAVPTELGEVLERASREQLLFFLLTLRHGVRSVEARLAWCDEALQTLREESRRQADNS